MSNDKRNDPWLGDAVAGEGRDAEQQPAGTASAPGSSSGPPWERALLEQLALDLFKERRRSRRWGIFFKSLMFAYLIALFIVFMPEAGDSGVSLGKHTALVDIHGVIAADSEANADSIITGLRAAFKSKGTVGIILRINSPGGSPVQAGYINDEIIRLKKRHPDIPVYAVISDICASGGYYIAVAADKIYADKASMVGSIGVLMDGFGFVGAMDKLGVERRLITAGKNKGFLDPFSPLKQEDKRYIKTMLSDIHRQFIATVKKGRGERLKKDDSLFSGLIWTGEQSVALGLVDALGSSAYVAREIFGAEKIVDFTHRQPLLQRFAERLGGAAARTFTSMSELR